MTQPYKTNFRGSAMLKKMRRIARATRKYKLAWRYAYNLLPTLSYQRRGSSLSNEAQRVLRDLNRDGIAISSVEALLGSDSGYSDLLATVASLQVGKAVEIETARANASDATSGSPAASRAKPNSSHASAKCGNCSVASASN